MKPLSSLLFLGLWGCAAGVGPETAADLDYREALHTQDDRRAIEFLDRAILKHPLPHYLMVRGMLHQTLGETSAALRDYAAALEHANQEPLTGEESARLHFNRGALFRGTARLREAEDDFSEAIRLAPGYTEAYLERSALRRQLGRPAEAESDLAQARKVGAGQADRFYNEGVRSVNQRDDADAERMFRMALQLDPEHSLAHIGMARLYMERRRFQEAAAEFDRAIPAHPKDAELFYHRGTCFMESGQREKGMADLTKAVELDPQPVYLAARGIGYHRVLKDDAKAKADFAEATRIDPDCYVAWFDSGLLHHELGELGAAESDLRRAMGLHASPEGTLALGRVFHDRKEYDKALELYRLGLELYKDPEVRRLLEEESERSRRAKEDAK